MFREGCEEVAASRNHKMSLGSVTTASLELNSVATAGTSSLSKSRIYL
jgi:hypothetical protein